MSDASNCGRCHLAGVPQVLPSGTIVTDDFCGECPFNAIARDVREAVASFMEHEPQSDGEIVVDFPRDATPEEQREFWRRVDQHAAQYASVTVMMPPRFVGKVPPVVVFDDGGGSDQ